MDVMTTLSAIKGEIFAAMFDDEKLHGARMENSSLQAAVRIVARYEAAASAQASTTRRDELAAMAMQGLLAGGTTLDVAKRAYTVADEMLIKGSKQCATQSN